MSSEHALSAQLLRAATCALLAFTFSCALAVSFDGYETDPRQHAIDGGGDTDGDGTAAAPPRIVAITAGGSHTCALYESGEIRCWGANQEAQLGDETRAYRRKPVVVTGVAGATAVSAGEAHTCAVVAKGEVVCWGRDYATTKRKIAGLAGAVAVAAGGTHTCALLDIGEVRCWGSNSSGQLGDNTLTDSAKPVAAKGISGATAIAVGPLSLSCAVVAGGNVRCWGSYGNPSPLPEPVGNVSGATTVTAGMLHACAVAAGGEVRCWGQYLDGQPHTAAIRVGTLEGATAVAARGAFDGDRDTCAVVGGGIWCWRAREAPLPISVPPARSIAAGAAHTCALLVGDADVRCWGSNEQGQIGAGAPSAVGATPVAVVGLR